jgi:hypothetical protein
MDKNKQNYDDNSSKSSSLTTNIIYQQVVLFEHNLSKELNTRQLKYKHINSSYID